MINGKKIAVVLPAYNAALTLKATFDEIDHDIVDVVILVDDYSTDDTVKIANELGLIVIEHDQNKGYGGNQKTCYKTALEHDADIVVMLHPDYQYTPLLVTAMSSMIAYDVYDFVLASRIIGPGAVKEGGMPIWKYMANRFLTAFENLMIGYKLSEYHSGFRAFSRELLDSLRLDELSDDFVFDNQMIAQIVCANFKIGEISCPTRYDEDSSSINFRRSVKYGLGVLTTSIQYRLHKNNIKKYSYLEPLPSPATEY
jgi:glycosyltransferase involved in cell wall biosynthesis